MKNINTKLFALMMFGMPVMATLMCSIANAQTVPIEIHNCQELQNMENNINGSYVLANNIDCTDTKNWNNGSGFLPIGGNTTSVWGFSGTLDGKGHKISNLYMHRGGDVGLFALFSGTVRDLRLENVDIAGPGPYYGSVAAILTQTPKFINIIVSGKMDTSGIAVGGVVGLGNVAYSRSVLFDHINSSVNITHHGGGSIGGIIGNSGNVDILYSKYAGKITITDVDSFPATIGGIIGDTSGTLPFIMSSIAGSYSIVNLENTNAVNVKIGGLAGYAGNTIVNESYSVITKSANVLVQGGLIASGTNITATKSFWDKEVSGMTTSLGSDASFGKTSAEMKMESTFSYWDYSSVWTIQEGQDYPHFVWEASGLQITPAQVSPQVNYVEHQTPHIEGINAVWVDYDRSVYKSYIQHYNLATKKLQRIAEGSGPVRINGNLLFWGEGSSCYDLSTGAMVPLPSGASKAVVYGDKIIYFKVDNSSQVYLYDRVSGQSTQLTTVGPVAGWPSISGDTLLWQENNMYSMSPWSVHYFNLKIRGFAPSINNAWSPAISGDNIVYIESFSPANRVRMLDLATGQDTVLFTLSNLLMSALSFSGDWVSYTDGFPMGAVKMFNVKTQQQATVDNGSLGGGIANAPISNDRIIYQKSQGIASPYTSWSWIDTRIYTADLNPDRESVYLRVTKQGTGQGKIVSNPVAMDCGDTCQAQLDKNSAMELKAVKSGGSIFNGWSGACSGMAITCTLTMDADKNVTANFVQDVTPPVLSNGVPAGSLAAGVVQVNMMLTTNEDSTCKYDTAAGKVFGSMGSTFSTTGQKSHSQLITGLTSASTKLYYVRCQDVSGNANTMDYQIKFYGSAVDWMPPTQVTNLRATATNQVSVSLAWNASTDDKSKVGYRVFRNGTSVVGTTLTSFTDSGLSAGKTYVYTVQSYDSSPARNAAALSAPLSVTTQAATPPVGNVGIGNVGYR